MNENFRNERSVERAAGCRVAVVSLYARGNYGNCLQRHAVHTLIEECGCSAVSLDARKITKDYAKEVACGLAARLPIHAVMVERARRFASFDAPCASERTDCRRLSSLSDRYEAFVVGSDQVWNPRVWDFEPEYNLLSFVKPPSKRIALAPSFGISELDEESFAAFRSALGAYERISVRESEGADIIEQLLGRPAEVLCDPTMALSRAHWESVADRSMAPDLPYVVVYELGRGAGCLTEARELAWERGLSVVELNNPANTYYAAGPQDFVGLIAGAEAVFTDSFHACVFSLICHTPFKAFARKGLGYSMGSRIVTLGRSFDVAVDDLGQDYDWHGIDTRRDSLAAAERAYLASELDRAMGRS